jgi:hypothetical protein
MAMALRKYWSASFALFVPNSLKSPRAFRVVLVRREIGRLRPLDLRALIRGQLNPQQLGETGDDAILEREDVIHLSVDLLGIGHRAGFGIGEVRR